MSDDDVRDTGDKCVCGGRVVMETRSEAAPGYENFIGRCPSVEIKTIYCASCGILYRFPPSIAKKRGKSHGVVMTEADAKRKRRELGLED